MGDYDLNDFKALCSICENKVKQNFYKCKHLRIFRSYCTFLFLAFAIAANKSDKKKNPKNKPTLFKITLLYPRTFTSIKGYG